MAIVQCRSRAQWPAKLKQLSLRSCAVDQELRMGGDEGRPLATAGIIIGSRIPVTGKATTSTKHNHMRPLAGSFDFELIVISYYRVHDHTMQHFFMPI
jgi:hypothetical protein